MRPHAGLPLLLAADLPLLLAADLPLLLAVLVRTASGETFVPH